MRSIPGAMIWETFHHGKWNLLMGFLGANAMPVLLFTALSHQGLVLSKIDSTEPSLVGMHLILMQISMFIFGAGVLAAQGLPSRLYTTPIATSALVTWHMLPAMLLVAVSTMFLNALFHVHWPIWGPALYVAVFVAAVQAAIWQTEKTAWVVFAFTFVAGVLGLWFKARHGVLFGQPSHFWETVTPLEVATLLLFAVVSYRAAVAGVARNRRGDTLKSLGIVAWIERVLDPPPYDGPAFGSAIKAQYWSEWTRKGWAMPVCAVFGLVLFLVCWVFFVRDPQELFMGFVVGGGILSIGGLIGALLMGNIGPNDATYEIGHFMATRPITNRDLARIILQVSARSVLMGWLIWAGTFLVAYLLLLASQVTLQPLMPDHLSWWCYFSATLLGPWVVVTLGTAIGLTGQRWLFLELFCTMLGLFFIGIPVTEYALTRENRELLALGLTAAVGVLFVLLTAWAMIAARRRALIALPTVCIAAVAWLVLSTAVILLGVLHPMAPIAVYVLIVGILALAVAPLATAPLALTWNRTR